MTAQLTRPLLTLYLPAPMDVVSAVLAAVSTAYPTATLDNAAGDTSVLVLSVTEYLADDDPRVRVIGATP